MTRVVGFDPGRSKCGLVLVETDSAQVLDSDVLVPEAVLNTLDQWSQGGNLPMIVMGDGTGSDAWKKMPARLLPWSANAVSCAV